MPITDITVWKRLSPLLDEVLDLEPPQREAWIASLGPEHEDLRATLEEILHEWSAVETSDFLRTPLEFSDVSAGMAVSPGDRIGPYRLIRKLGSGGTSDVWLAERADGALQRQLAIKFPHLGFIDSGLAARLVRERDILAGLEHPNIARLYDAGVDEKGRPYLALEYVDGIPPDQYCKQHACTVRQRLELFLQIARAVAFAHGRLIVHRDLKPNNVLVAKGGEVRLLDFGIARLLQGDAAASPLLTQMGGRALTPAYAAPEQFSKQPITVATDVYSLGVILFELLAGRSPYPPTADTVGALEHAVLTSDLPLASSVAAPAEKRALRGDLDTILAKALRKPPDERYASVEAFAADIERHMDGLPIAARPQSFWYVARKFTQRNALPVGLTAAAVLALTAISGIAIVQWQRAVAQRAIAVERLTEAELTADFTTAVLTESMQSGEKVSLEELLARSEKLAETSGATDPRVRLLATDLVADWYLGTSWYDKAEHLIARNVGGLPVEMSARLSELKCKHALSIAGQGRMEDAIGVLSAQIARNDTDPRTAAYCLQVRAEIAQALGDSRNALKFSLEAERSFDAAGLQSLTRKGSLLETVGRSYGLNDQPDRAQEYYRRAMSMFERAGRSEGHDALITLNNWATVVNLVGNAKGAMELFERAWKLNAKHSPTGQAAPVVTNNYGSQLVLLGRYSEALVVSTAGAEEALRTHDFSAAATAYLISADVERRLGHLGRAQEFLDKAAVKRREGKVSEEEPSALKGHLQQGQLWAAQGRLAEGAAEVTRSIDSYIKRECCADSLAYTLSIRSAMALSDHRPEDALSDAQHALDVSNRARGSERFSVDTGTALFAIGRVHESQARYREAREAYLSAAEHFTHTLGEQHADTLAAHAGASRAAKL
ncbi:MAG: serine/threonine-protein kinase [Gammaproteobacteria bacterium]